MPNAQIDDHQAFLIEGLIMYASEGDYFKITGEMIDAIIADRLAILKVTALEKAIQDEHDRSIF